MEKGRGFQKNTYFHFIGYNKAFVCVDDNKLWMLLKEMEIPDHLTCLLKNLYASQEATVRTGCGAMDWFKMRKGVWQGYIVSPCLLTYMQSTSWKCQARWITSWNQDFQEKYQQPQVYRWHQSSGRKWRGTEILLMRVKEESEKTGLKLNIWKTKIMASDPTHQFMADKRGESGNSNILFSWASKSLQMVTAAMKLKDTCSLEGKVCQTFRQHIKKWRHHFTNKSPSSQSYGFPSSHI